MDKLIFALCGTTAFLCGLLLIRSYFRARSPMLFWSGLCFFFLSASNWLIILDRWVFPAVDLSPARLSAAAIGLALLIYGLIWGIE
jgi:hypothetical protein